jgi:hypothetical protein
MGHLSMLKVARGSLSQVSSLILYKLITPFRM